MTADGSDIQQTGISEPSRRRRRRRKPAGNPNSAPAQTTDGRSDQAGNRQQGSSRTDVPAGSGASGAGKARRSRRPRKTGTSSSQTTVASSQPVTKQGSKTSRSNPPSRSRRSSLQAGSRRKPAGRGRAALRLASRSRAPAQFAANWWARRWIAALEKFGWTARLERGQDYARRGNVLDLEIVPGLVTAQVQGSRPWPYKVEIGLEPLNDEKWERVVKRLGRQALYTAKLLAGDMPQNIEDIFNAAEVALIPKAASALAMSCSCPDPVSPCKHIGAVHYVLAAEFDRDPFVLFELRGRTRQDIVKALKGRPSDHPINALPLVPQGNGSQTHGLENFWKAPSDLAAFPVHISPAAVPGGLLKRLGPLPLRGQSDDWRTQLFDVYRLVGRRAYALGRGDEPGKNGE